MVGRSAVSSGQPADVLAQAKTFEAEAVLPQADQAILQRRKLFPAAFDKGVFVPQRILFFMEEQSAVIQQGDGVRDLVQVAGDVGGQQDGVAFLLQEFQKDIQNFIPYQGIPKPLVGSSSISSSAPWLMAAAMDSFIFIPREKSFTGFFSGRLKAERYRRKSVSSQRPYSRAVSVSAAGEDVVKTWLVEHHSDALLDRGFLRQIVLPEHPDVPRIPADQIQNQLDGGAFPRAVGAHQPGDGARRHGQRDVGKLKISVAFAQSLYF